MLAVIVFPHGFTTALASEAFIVPRASHRRITPTACLGRVLGAEPQVRCRCLRLPQLVRQLRVAPPLPNLYVPFVAAYGSHLPLFHDQSSFGTASAHPTFPLISYQVPLAHFLPGRVGFKTVTCSYPSVGTAFAVCTSHYSRTLSNIGPPSSCRFSPV